MAEHAEVVGEEIVVTTSRGKELKAIGASYDRKRDAWTLPATRMNAKLVNDLALPLPVLSVGLAAPESVSDTRLYGYQARAIGRLAAAPHGQILVAAPGLGKTAMAIAAADLAVPDDKVVVVTLASLLYTWRREIQKWGRVPGEVYVVEGKLDYEAAAAARWIVVSWDKAVREAAIWGRGWPLWVLDESVLAKSRGSKRFKTLRKLRGTVGRFWLLSGSPTTKYTDDLWAQLHLIWPRAFPSYWRFADYYCTVEDTPWARVVTGDRSARSAVEDNSDLIIVINEEDAGLNLPEYLFEPPIEVVLKGAQAKAYRDMSRTFITQLGSGQQVVAENEASMLLRLQQIASYWDGESAKRDALLEVIDHYDPPYLIWTHWRDTATDLMGALQAHGISTDIVTGATARKERDARIEAFKAGEFEALILSLGVGKFGLTMTNVRTIFGVDRSFNADDIFQAGHRVRRIGLTHHPVVVPIVAVGTVDELTVGENLAAKLGGIARMTRSNLAALLKGIGR